jgi:ABC-type amino acid transport system permease subunit
MPEAVNYLITFYFTSFEPFVFAALLYWGLVLAIEYVVKQFETRRNIYVEY